MNKCLICEKDTINLKYCSRVCFKLGFKETQKGARNNFYGHKNSKKNRKTKIKHVCFACDKDTFNVKYCSRICANRDIANKKSLNSKEKRICEGCGDPFIVNISSDHKYCTQKCAYKHMGKKRIGIIVTPRIEKFCIICGISFIVKITSTKKLCSSPICKSIFTSNIQKGVPEKEWVKKQTSDYMKLHPKIGKDNPRFNPNKSESRQYKIDGLFKFDMGEYPEIFDLRKVKNMYHPVKNKEGYVRDHMFSRQDGFDQKIDPKIISHPANCQLITNSENACKRNKSCITLNELLERIRLWDIKYNNKVIVNP